MSTILIAIIKIPLCSKLIDSDKLLCESAYVISIVYFIVVRRIVHGFMEC